MIWTESGGHYLPWACDKKLELEKAIALFSSQLFGKTRVYQEVMKLIGEKARNLDGVF
jgi:hypothetical protein